MEVLNKDEFNTKRRTMVRKLKEAVFVYPTDTIYGLGCDARKEELVAKIRELKSRDTMPFSVIAPSRDWIRENCVVNSEVEQWLEKLPGPYTLILKLKNKEAIAPNVNDNMDTLGVRIPDNWFTQVVREMKVPVVTTSANATGGDFMTTMDNLNAAIKSNVDFIIYTGELKGRPSTLVHLELVHVEIQER